MGPVLVQRVDVQKPHEQKERETSAHVSEDDHAALSTYLLRQMEGERSQLAKQLHDELGGLITAAKMDMQWLSAHIGKTLDAQGTEKFRSVLQMLDQAMTLKRRVVETLRPSLLDHFGLGVAMRSHFDEQCRAAGIDCVASLPEETMALDAATQLTLFRVAQDVLAGVLARGGAKNVELVVEPHVDEQGDGYVMTIGDDGAIMDLDLARQMPSARHRVALAGGRIDAEARAGSGGQPNGNRVRVFVPRSAAGSA
jgi:protein-histidine pros-kinase